MSLSSWFRDYVYIPLGGNRHGFIIQIRNILIVWLLTGLWHGASWNFILWGLYFGIVLIFEKWWGLRLLIRLPRWMRHLYALLIILIGWVLFAFDEPALIISYLGAMWGLNGQSLWNSDVAYLLYTNAVLLIVLIFASLPNERWSKKELSLLHLGWYGCLFLLSVAYLVDASFNPFLYFRF